MKPARTAMARNSPTSVERHVMRWLDNRGVRYESAKLIGRHFVDFYLPEAHMVVEADGAYWHRDQAKDIARDEALLAVDPSLTITHLHFHHKRFSPHLDLHPAQNVHYVSCNPGPKSFADPTVFTHTPILSLRNWRYESVVGTRRTKMRTCGCRPTAPHRNVCQGPTHDEIVTTGVYDSNQGWLYDLTVEGVHSFVVSGVIVSNSYVHENLQARHPTGQAKFLEQPLNEARRGMDARLAADVKDAVAREARR